MLIRRELTKLALAVGWPKVQEELTSIIAEYELDIKRPEKNDLVGDFVISKHRASILNANKREREAQKSVGSAVQAVRGVGRKPRNLSPEARKRIADAQKKRWASFRKAKRRGEL